MFGGFSGAPGGHVFRTSLTAAAWTDISPPIDLPFNAIALDGSDTPTALYTGTDFGVGFWRSHRFSSNVYCRSRQTEVRGAWEFALFAIPACG